MLLPKSFLDDVRARVRLSDVIGRRVKLTRAGREFKACCPFHNEKSASFYINDEKGFFHCFGCGAHGDQIGFLMRHENRSFMDAVEELAQAAGLQVPKPTVQDMERARGRERLLALMDAATKWYARQLFAPANKPVLDYVLGRGLTLETVHAFRLGYSPADSAALASAMKEAGYTLPELMEAGLFKPSQREGGSPFAFFRDRVMFPVTDRRGQTIAFGGRVLPESLRPLKAGEAKPPKYINSGETALFQKGHILYNESHARAAAAKGSPVIVCEGYADVISLWQAGFTGAVAPLGTALTEAQIGALWAMIPETDAHGVREPVLCFDGDAAGQRAATRAMDRILPQLQAGRSARFAFLPDGMDPDDLLRAKGPQAFEAVLGATIPMSEMIWRTLTEGRRFDTPEGKAGLQKAIHDLCAQIADLGVQKQYEKALKDRFYQAFSQRTAGSAGGKKPSAALPAVRIPAPDSNKARKAARLALAAILTCPSIFADAEEVLGRLHIEDQRLDALRQSLMSALSDSPEMDRAVLLQNLSTRGFAGEVKDLRTIARLEVFGGPEGEDPQVALAMLRDMAQAA